MAIRAPDGANKQFSNNGKNLRHFIKQNLRKDITEKNDSHTKLSNLVR